MPTAQMMVSKLQRLADDLDEHVTTIVVTTAAGDWTVTEHGPRAGRGTITVTGPAQAGTGSPVVEQHLGYLRQQHGYVWGERYRGTLRLTAQMYTGRDCGERIGAAALAAHHRRHRNRHLPLRQMIAGAPRAAGPRWLIALERFTTEVRSEPVAQALHRIREQVTCQISTSGPAAFVLPAPVAAAVSRVYGPVCATAYTEPAPSTTTPEVLETMLTLWTPHGDTEMAFLDDAWQTALTLTRPHRDETHLQPV